MQLASFTQAEIPVLQENPHYLMLHLAEIAPALTARPEQRLDYLVIVKEQ